MKQGLILGQDHWQQMLEHIHRHAPLEACGLLAGKAHRVERVLPIRNQAQSPVRFVMDPYEQLQAFAWIDSSGLDLLGIFHSHPAGPATASQTDIEEAAYEVVYLIWSKDPNGWRARGFWIQNGRATEVSLQIVD
jgi:[CysO sulfur-carrier protein]-S-L-cysteine hydrolase